MAFVHIRKFVFQNPTSGKNYEVSLQLNADGTGDGKALLLGVDKITSSPDISNTKISFVVVTSHISKVFGSERNGWKHESVIKQGAYFDASNKAGAGATLASLLV